MNKEEIVMKSRVRLARNLKDYPFPNKLSEEEASKVIEEVNKAIIDSKSILKDEFILYEMKNLDNIQKQSMIEEYLISIDLANNQNGAVLIKKDKTVSIMINEEDHIRIQVVLDGLKLDEAYDLVNKIDDVLDERLMYAFDETLGYLTSCPTNTGTGMRASVMLHLPALTELEYIHQVYKVSSKIGLAIRGMYGEKSESLGNIYQISNQLTLGRTEKSTLDNIQNMANELISKEIQARELIIKKLGIHLEDRIFRSLAILQNARVISSKEAMNHLSNIKLGIDINYLNNISISEIDNLIIAIQPGHQSNLYNSKDIEDRDINRANYVRTVLNK